MVAVACSSRFSSSRVSMRSLFQMRERSVTRTSAKEAKVAPIRSIPWPRVSPVRNTAASSCMAFCISTRMAAVPRVPLAWRRQSSSAMAASGDPRGTGRERSMTRTGPDELGATPGRLASEDHEVQQRVAAEPVGAVHRDAGGFACGHETWHYGVGIALLRLHHLAVVIARDAAHVVVHCRLYRNRLEGHIHAGENARRLGDA